MRIFMVLRREGEFLWFGEGKENYYGLEKGRRIFMVWRREGEFLWFGEGKENY